MELGAENMGIDSEFDSESIPHTPSTPKRLAPLIFDEGTRLFCKFTLEILSRLRCHLGGSVKKNEKKMKAAKNHVEEEMSNPSIFFHSVRGSQSDPDPAIGWPVGHSFLGPCENDHF